MPFVSLRMIRTTADDGREADTLRFRIEAVRLESCRLDYVGSNARRELFAEIRWRLPDNVT